MPTNAMKIALCWLHCTQNLFELESQARFHLKNDTKIAQHEHILPSPTIYLPPCSRCAAPFILVQLGSYWVTKLDAGAVPKLQIHSDLSDQLCTSTKIGSNICTIRSDLLTICLTGWNRSQCTMPVQWITKHIRDVDSDSLDGVKPGYDFVTQCLELFI